MPTTSINRLKLRQLLTTHFNEGELRTFCFDLGIDYDDIPGNTKTNKVTEIITYLERRNQLTDLLIIGQSLRSDIPWKIATNQSDLNAIIPNIPPEQSGETKITIYYSFTRYDDINNEGKITYFIQKLSKEIQILSPDDIGFNDDITDIPTRRYISRGGFQDISILICLISTNYFNSEWCREEAFLFLERERYFRNKHLIIPVHYQRNNDLERALRDNEEHKTITNRLLSEIANHSILEYSNRIVSIITGQAGTGANAATCERSRM
jgi:hypothetical protein